MFETGAENFHLSQKISTRYSAIAFQIGCPYLDNFNTVYVYDTDMNVANGYVILIPTDPFHVVDETERVYTRIYFLRQSLAKIFSLQVSNEMNYGTHPSDDNGL